MSSRIECPYCRRVGLVRAERVFKGAGASTSYYCGGCNRTWERRDSPAPAPVRGQKDRTDDDPPEQ
jgi:DNA-directed RNA polymerase subunit RPC12/RpoP